jgi:hypothetical protein
MLMRGLNGGAEMEYIIKQAKEDEQFFTALSEEFGTPVATIKKIAGASFDHVSFFEVYQDGKFITLLPYFEVVEKVKSKDDYITIADRLHIFSKIYGLDTMALMKAVKGYKSDSNSKLKLPIILHLPHQESSYKYFLKLYNPCLKLDKLDLEKYKQSKQWIKRYSKSWECLEFVFKRYDRLKDSELFDEYVRLLKDRHTGLPSFVINDIDLIKNPDEPLYVSCLKDNGRYVSICFFSFNDKESCTYFSFGFDKAYEKISPGTCMLFKSIGCIQKLKLAKEILFGYVFEDQDSYKHRWTKESKESELFYLL